MNKFQVSNILLTINHMLMVNNEKDNVLILPTGNQTSLVLGALENSSIHEIVSKVREQLDLTSKDLNTEKVTPDFIEDSKHSLYRNLTNLRIFQVQLKEMNM